MNEGERNGRGGFQRTENPREKLQAGFILTLVNRQRQAPDDPIGLRYPIRVYQSGQSSRDPSSAVPFIIQTSMGGLMSEGLVRLTGRYIISALSKRLPAIHE